MVIELVTSLMSSLSSFDILVHVHMSLLSFSSWFMLLHLSFQELQWGECFLGAL